MNKGRGCIKQQRLPQLLWSVDFAAIHSSKRHARCCAAEAPGQSSSISTCKRSIDRKGSRWVTDPHALPRTAANLTISCKPVLKEIHPDLLFLAFRALSKEKKTHKKEDSKPPSFWNRRENAQERQSIPCKRKKQGKPSKAKEDQGKGTEEAHQLF